LLKNTSELDDEAIRNSGGSDDRNEVGLERREVSKVEGFVDGLEFQREDVGGGTGGRRTELAVLRMLEEVERSHQSASKAPE